MILDLLPSLYLLRHDTFKQQNVKLAIITKALIWGKWQEGNTGREEGKMNPR